MAWLAANVSLLGPLVSLTIDTKNFCQGLFRTKVVILFSLVQGIMAFLIILVRPYLRETYVSGFLRLYDFHQSFRYQVAGVTVAGIIAYAVLVHTSRQLLEGLQRRRVHPP